MEIRRYLNTRLWRDSWFETLNANEKFVYVYLLTNPSTNMLGIYNLSIRRIAYDCNLNEQTARRCIKKLEEISRIMYRKGYVIIPDWISQNAMNPSMKQSAMKDFDKLPADVCQELPLQLLTAIQKMRPARPQPVPTLFAPFPPETPEKEEETEQEQAREEQEQQQEEEKKTGNALPPAKVNENVPQPLKTAYEQATFNQSWLEALCMNHRLTPGELQQWLELFCRKLENEGNTQKSVRDFRQHFANWLHIQLENLRKHPQCHENPATTNLENSRQRKLDAIAMLKTTVSNDARQRILELEATGILPPLPKA